MQEWEYNLLVQSPNTECARCEEALNGLGRDGWELVTFYVKRCGGQRLRFKKAERTISGRGSCCQLQSPGRQCHRRPFHDWRDWGKATRTLTRPTAASRAPMNVHSHHFIIRSTQFGRDLTFSSLVWTATSGPP
jgi:hypothetical protein